MRIAPLIWFSSGRKSMAPRNRGYWDGVMVAHLCYARCSSEDCNCHNPLLVHLLDGPAADLQAFGQLPLANPP